MKRSTPAVVPDLDLLEPPHDSAHRTLNDGRDALNLCEFPLAALSGRVPQNQKTLVFEDTLKRQGSETPRRLIVAASEKYGLPTAMDDEVILGLIQLSKRDNFRSRTVPFTRYDLIRLLGWRDEGRSYRRIEESLLRWVSVTLVYEGAWWDKEEASLVNESFHILERVTLYDRERRQRRRAKGIGTQSSFTWNEVVFRSFRAGYLKKLDLAVYRSLRSAVAKRLYRFLDKRLHHRNRWEFDLRHLCCDKLGMSRRGHTGELKRSLQVGLAELEQLGIVQPAVAESRFIKLSAGEWTVIVEGGKGTRRKASSTSDPLTESLVERGVHAATARQLARQHSADVVKDRIALHDWLLGRKDKRIARSPAGFLVESIRGEFPLPLDFERQARRPSPKHAPKQVHVARPVVDDASADDAGLDKLWSTLDDAARAEHESRALASASKLKVETFRRLRDEGSSLFDSIRREILMAHLRRCGLLPPITRTPAQGRGE
ncbi:MAG: replication initiator protein A [Pirellulales bacterium]|nr:replication initiator protein A [Pirellulales bacterium]